MFLFRRKSRNSARPQSRWGSHRQFVGDRSAYALPNDDTEISRLDLQHYVMRYMLHGNYAVPFRQLHWSPQSILDVACGTGRWGAEMAAEFPTANIIGIDIVKPDATSPSITLGKPKIADNYIVEEADVRKGLPYADNSFDYVHMRFLVVAISKTDWPPLIAELLRVTRPGGVIEVVETVLRDVVGSPAHQQFFRWFHQLAQSRNYEYDAGEKVAGWLQQAGLLHVTQQRLAVPIGDWGGRLGVMMRTDIMAAAQGMLVPVVQTGMATDVEANAVLDGMEQAFKTMLNISSPFFVVYGQKPYGRYHGR